MQKLLLAIAAATLLLSQSKLSAQYSNTGYGANALSSITTGTCNSAFGDSALFSATTANYNSAFGGGALFSATTGSDNSASGCFALLNLIDGSRNTAMGSSSLFNTNGNDNTAVGYLSLTGDFTGARNVAVGSYAVFTEGSATDNVGVGYQALATSDFGFNTAIGSQSQPNNAWGQYNVSIGYQSLYGLNATSGVDGNIAIGALAMQNLKTGYNIGIGFNTMTLSRTATYNVVIGGNSEVGDAGYNNVILGHQSGAIGMGNIVVGSNAGSTGDNNIDIGAAGGTENSTIRIGDPTLQTDAYIAGISGAATNGGQTVYVDADGKLGTEGGNASIDFLLPAPVGTQPTQLSASGPQSFTVVLSATTNNSSRTAELTLDGNAPATSGAGMNVLIPPNNTSWGYCITVTAGGSGPSKVFRKRGVLKNVGGTISYAGPVGSTEINDGAVGDTAATNWAISQNATAPSGRLRYTVDQSTGSAFTVHWSARVEVVATPNN